MKCLVINSKVAFDPKLNPSMRMDVKYLSWLQELAEAKRELDEALAHGRKPTISRERLAKVISFVRGAGSRSPDARRAKAMVDGVLASRTLAEASGVVRKAFQWDMPQYDELVAKAILECARVEEQARFDLAAARLNAICRKAEEWK